MITEILGLAGSGVAGSVFGIVSDMMQARSERKRLEVELEIKRRANESNQTLNHVAMVTSKPFFGFSFGMLVFTYCACALICFTFPDVIVWTFNPDDVPKKFQVLWGLASFEWKHTKVYEVSTGGLGYALLHPIAFQIGSVITGINANGRR